MIPQLDVARCVRARFSGAGCSACADACASEAFTFNGVAGIAMDRCNGCTACIAVCPTDAITESGTNVEAIIASGARLIGCSRSGAADGRVTCLASLAEEHLIALGAAVLDATACATCPWSGAMHALRDRVARVGGDLVLVRTTHELALHTPRMDRRAWFRSLVRGPVVVPEPDPVPAGVKVVPPRRRLLNRVRPSAPERAARCDRGLEFRPDCDECGRCAAVCPTGALDHDLSFDPELCTGCRLCSDFCPTDSLRVV